MRSPRSLSSRQRGVNKSEIKRLFKVWGGRRGWHGETHDIQVSNPQPSALTLPHTHMRALQSASGLLVFDIKSAG